MRAMPWETLKDLVADALERAPCDRAGFVEAACPDPDLRAELVSLIEAAEPEELGIVLDPRADAFAGLRGTNPASFSGTRFGEYTLGRILGEGGSGVVYLARQRGVDRDVAIKVYAPQSIGFDARLRFEREVRALGRVTHRGVARIYDAGLYADEARPDAMPVPYIAMELVEGLPITRHAAVNALPLRARISLLADAAEAVHAAHQRAVIHRDLKPANILVARADGMHPFGSIKVLDFGIARVLHEDHDDGGAWAERAGDDPVAFVRTTAGLLLGSLAYMSPEQARGEGDAVDVRSDVYALGVVLYELVTGRTPVPIEELPLTESLRRLADPDLRMPRVEQDFTGGDLATVLSAALAPEREQRYASAEAFAQDLRRLLQSEPVAARPPSRVYRAKKFLKRHRVGVGAVSAMVLAIVAGGAIASVGLVRERAARLEADRALAETERQRALGEAQRLRAEASRDFLAQIVASADPELFGRDATVVEAVRAALPMLGVMHAVDPGAESSLRLTVAQTFRNLGVLDEADEAFTEAHALAARAFGDGSAEAIHIALEHADLLGTLGRLEEARAKVETATVHVEAMPHGRDRDEVEMALRIARANLAFEAGDYAMSVVMYESILEALAEAPDLLSAYNTDTLRAHFGLALTYAGELSRAERVQRELVADRAERFGRNHPRTLAVMQQHAGTLTELGRLDEAEPVLEEILAHAEQVWGATHQYTLGVRHSTATIALTRGDFQSAAEIAGEILDDALPAADFDVGVVLFLAANTRAVAFASLEAWDEAVPAMQRVVDLATETFGPDHRYALVTRSSLANMLGQTGDLEGAIGELGALLEIHEQTQGVDSEDAMITRNNLAMLELEAGRAERAIELLRISLQNAIDTERRAMVPIFRRNLGRALTVSGAYDEAELELLKSLEEGEGLLNASQQQRTKEALGTAREARDRADR